MDANDVLRPPALNADGWFLYTQQNPEYGRFSFLVKVSQTESNQFLPSQTLTGLTAARKAGLKTLREGITQNDPFSILIPLAKIRGLFLHSTRWKTRSCSNIFRC